MKKVLITGMSGLIGGLLRERLEDAGGYELSALNRRPVDGVEGTQADIGDLEAIKPAFNGIDVVAHLAASVDANNWDPLLASNLIGTYNVYEAARLAGVKRVVFASSGSTIRGYERVEPYKSITEGRHDEVSEDFPRITHDIFRPDSIYGATKVWGEALGRYYSDEFGLSILCVRIGSVTEEDRPRSEREYSIYLSNSDVCQILLQCIDAPDDLKFDVFLATSNNRWSYRDLSHARDVIGYLPQDSADQYR